MWVKSSGFLGGGCSWADRGGYVPRLGQDARGAALASAGEDLPPRAHGAGNSKNAKQLQSHEAQARTGPALGQGQHPQLTRCPPTAHGHRTEAKEEGGSAPWGQ